MFPVIRQGKTIPDHSTLYQSFATKKIPKFRQVEIMFPVIGLGHTIPDHLTYFQVFEIHNHAPNFWPLKYNLVINFNDSKNCCASPIIILSGSASPPVCDQSWNWLPLVGGILTCQYIFKSTPIDIAQSLTLSSQLFKITAS